MFFVAYFSILFSFKVNVLVFMILSLLLFTGRINNFHNVRGHYGEISLRQQPITARDFTGSNLCHIIKQFNKLLNKLYNFKLFFQIMQFVF